MRTYDKIKDMLCNELDEIAKKNELTSNNLEIIYKASDILKDLASIEAMEQEYPSGYSKDGGYSNGYYERYPYYIYDGDGNSYARGRGMNARRDSMGRYSRDSHEYSNEGYSRDATSELQRMMENVKSEKEREALRQAISTMQHM